MVEGERLSRKISSYLSLSVTSRLIVESFVSQFMLHPCSGPDTSKSEDAIQPRNEAPKKKFKEEKQPTKVRKFVLRILHLFIRWAHTTCLHHSIGCHSETARYHDRRVISRACLSVIRTRLLLFRSRRLQRLQFL